MNDLLNDNKILKTIELLRNSPHLTKLLDKFYINNKTVTPFASFQEAFQDRNCAVYLTQSDINNFKFVPDEFKNEKAFILEVIKENSGMFQYLSSESQNDRNFVLEAIKLNGNTFQYISTEFKNDKEIILTAINNKGKVLPYISHELRHDQNIALAALKADKYEAQQFIVQDFLYPLQRKLFDEEEKIKDFIEKNKVEKTEDYEETPTMTLPQVKAQTKITKLAEKFYQGVENKPTLTEAYQSHDFIVHVVKEDSTLLQYLPSQFKEDKEVVLEAAKNNGMSLLFASNDFFNDRDVVLEAVKSNGRVFQYLPESLRHDTEVFYHAVKNESSAIRHTSEKLQKFVIEEGIDKLEPNHIGTRVANVVSKLRAFFDSPLDSHKNKIS